MTDRNNDEGIDVELPGPEGNGLGGLLPEPDVYRRGEPRPTRSEEVLDEEEDSQSAENDDDLTSGRSPEFEHLTRPLHDD